ncbi:putative endonuclease-reverse transcriptase [Trichonephila clavipes]|nr:putative endonuclease-reverse transcriptase [Trichonephila clavipes]
MCSTECLTCYLGLQDHQISLKMSTYGISLDVSFYHPQPAPAVPKLRQQVQQAWNSIPQSDIRHQTANANGADGQLSDGYSSYTGRDANAKIGMEKEFRQIVGKGSLRDLSNYNRKWLIDFAANHNMVISSTMFQNERNIETQSQGVVEPPSLEEVIAAINKLKHNKAPDPDTISSELLKDGGKETSKKVYDLIQAIWEQEVIPKEQKMSITGVIHKKGDILESSNYRGICLL